MFLWYGHTITVDARWGTTDRRTREDCLDGHEAEFSRTALESGARRHRLPLCSRCNHSTRARLQRPAPSQLAEASLEQYKSEGRGVITSLA